MIQLKSLRHALSKPVSRIAPTHLRSLYPELYRERVQVTDDGATFHRGQLWRREGVNIVSVVGDRFEMAFQHGRLLAAEIKSGALIGASKLVERNIDNSVGDGRLSAAVNWWAKTCLGETILRNGVENARRRNHVDPLMEGWGLAEGSGMPMETILRAAVGPEVLQTLLGMAASLAVGAEPNQCTSFAAWGSASAEGDMLIGRNFDYMVNGYFDSHPTVLYFSPTDGAQRYMGVTSAGFHNVGHCGMNEAGIYLALHVVPSKVTSEQGFPIYMVGQEILREARSFEEAVELFQEFKPAGGWSYHLVSTRERRAATVELASDRTDIVVHEGDFHVTTNHWQNPAMVDRLLALNETIDTDTRQRKARVTEMLEEARGTLDEEQSIAILADKFDRVSQRTRLGPNTVATSHNVSSSVWNPDKGVVYVGRDMAPVSQGAFVGFPTLPDFDPSTFSEWSCPVVAGGDFQRKHPKLAEAEQLNIRARRAYEYDNDAGAAHGYASAAAALNDDPACHLSAALYATSAGRMEAARESLSHVIEHSFDLQRVRVARYVRGRVAAHLGDAEGARSDLAWVIADAGADPRLRSAAKKIQGRLRLRRRIRLGLHEISPMCWLPDATRYFSSLPV